VSLLRALARLLDVWSALLLGVLVALGVIILLATPGPWHKVVSTPRVQIVAPPPSDVAVFVNGTPRARACSGVVWLHLSYDPAKFTAIVVPAKLQGRVWGGGYESLDRIVREAGPAPAATALQEILGVKIGGWVYLRRDGLRAAFPGFLPSQGTRSSRARLRESGFAWDGRGDATRQFRLQAAFLRRALAVSSFADLNLVAFVNFVLGSPASETNMKLQAVSAIGAVLKQTLPGSGHASALPARVLVYGGHARWTPDPEALLAFRQSFAFPLTEPPVYGADARRHVVPPRVVVLVSPLPRSLLRAYAGGLGQALRVSSGRRVAVDVVPVASPVTARAAAQEALPRTLGRTPPLAVIVAVGRAPGQEPGPLGGEVSALLGAAVAAGEPVLVSEVPSLPPGAWDACNAAIVTAAHRSGVPLSTVAIPLAGLLPSAPALDTALVRRWGKLNALALARETAPGLLAQRLAVATARFSWYARTSTTVTVVSNDPIRGPYEAALVANFGFTVKVSSSAPFATAGRATVYYRPADLEPALALAADLGLRAAALVPTAEAVAGPTLVLPAR